MMTTKAYKGLPMEGVIATWYSKITLKDIKRHKVMAGQLAQEIPTGGKVLEIARRNATQARLNIEFRQGNASAMPFPDNTFDFTFCQAAFKNFSEPVKAITEMYRVLRPGGRSVISDLRRDASSGDIEREVQGMKLGRINEIMVRWTFGNMLLKSAYRVDEMKSMIAQTPFGKAKINMDGIGFQVWLEK